MVQAHPVAVVGSLALGLGLAEPDRGACAPEVPDRLVALALHLADSMPAEWAEQLAVEGQAALDRGDDQVDVVDPVSAFCDNGSNLSGFGAGPAIRGTLELFHYHLVTCKVREVEARYLAKLGFGLVARYGRIGEEHGAFEPGCRGTSSTQAGFRLRLTELERGAVNVVVQPGQWALPRVDHFGVALDETSSGRCSSGRRCGAARAGARRPPDVHRHLRRLPPRGAPAARVDRELLGAADVLRLTELQLLADDPEAKAGALAELLDLEQDGERRGRRVERQLPPRRPARAARLYGELFTDASVARLVDSARVSDRTGRLRRRGGLACYREGIVERLRAAVDSTGARRLRRVRWPAPARREPAARSLDRRRRDEARALPPRRAAARRGQISPRTASTTCSRTGAEPLFLLDYVAAHELDLAQVAELVEGAAEVCREAGCALIGGETAELPGVYREEELDFAGTCVGIVERERLIDGSRCERGRPRARASVLRPARERLLARAGARRRGRLRCRSALAPHRLYLDEVRALRERADVKALAHVTGGGILGNLTRVLPEGVGVELDWDVVGAAAGLRLARRAGRRGGEQRRVFNLGIGIARSSRRATRERAP